jgi:hypothetical protein
MKLDTKTIREKFHQVFPNLQFVWAPDLFYMIPGIEELMQLVIATKVAAMRSDGELIDCDDYALQANAKIKEQRIGMANSLSPDESYHWAFGEAFGDKFNRLELEHTLCICCAQQGVFIIEPQTYDYWLADSKNDNALIIKL